MLRLNLQGGGISHETQEPDTNHKETFSIDHDHAEVLPKEHFRVLETLSENHQTAAYFGNKVPAFINRVLCIDKGP